MMASDGSAQPQEIRVVGQRGVGLRRGAPTEDEIEQACGLDRPMPPRAPALAAQSINA
jgi:hypothetical protein